MSNFTEYKVNTTSTWYGGQTFQVKELIYEPVKPINLVSETVLFTGSILECESFLRLKTNDNILNE